MKNRERFASTMLSMSLVLKMFGKEFDNAFQEVYWNALAPLTDVDFQRAAEILMRRETEFPPPALFFEVLRTEDAGAQAHRALMAAWNHGKQTIPGEGCWWSGALILEHVGPAAHEAFHACGGSTAFRDMDSEYHGPRIRREFVESYRASVAIDPARALPAGPQAPLLTTGQLLLEAEALQVSPETLDQVRADFLAQQSDDRRDLALPFTRYAPAPCTPEEQAQLDALGEKIAAKRRELAAQPPGGTA